MYGFVVNVMNSWRVTRFYSLGPVCVDVSIRKGILPQLLHCFRKLHFTGAHI